MSLGDLFFWKNKTTADNDWRPQPGKHEGRGLIDELKLPQWTSRGDLAATVVDVAPFVCGAGGIAHISQLNNLGWTVPASIFRNKRTMTAMYRTALVLPVTVLFCQFADIDYRQYIPRWSHDRERRRIDSEVREHISVGIGIGLGVWAVRMYALRWGRAYPLPLIETILGGALADLADREDRKAHGW